MLCIPVSIAKCGCKFRRKCYQTMLDNLLEAGEESCVENAPVGTATTTVFLHALQKYCGHLISVMKNGLTYEGKSLYEVVINGTTWGNKTRTVIILDAGQDGGVEPVGFALYVVEQLVSCEEYADMIQNVRWVILPSTNPDGLEYSRIKREYWKKNLKLIDNLSYGVDVTRNFDDSWSSCSANNNIFSQEYPGPKPNSENETIFITDVLNKYKIDAKAYISFRRDGHGIFYPYASINTSSDNTILARKMASNIAAKVNQKGGIHWFYNGSIYNINTKPHCGHSVDYAFNKLDIPYAYEMRIFLESNKEIMSQLQTLPRGYEASLRMSYFNGIKELYKLITKHKNIM